MARLTGQGCETREARRNLARNRLAGVRNPRNPTILKENYTLPKFLQFFVGFRGFRIPASRFRARFRRASRVSHPCHTWEPGPCSDHGASRPYCKRALSARACAELLQ